MNHEIRRGHELLETLVWDGPEFHYPEPEPVARARRELEQRAIARAFDLRALSFERRSPTWLESDHREFDCREVSPDEVAVETPVGVFRFAAHRARKGELTSAVSVGSAFIATGLRASEDQESPPIKLCGRLCPPGRPGEKWYFQPSCFVYADGTSSDYLGSYPREIAWEVEPVWFTRGADDDV